MNEKLQELMLYIAQESQNESSFGSVKLNKILFVADFLAYGLWGESITGATYRRMDYGPAPIELTQARDELIELGKAHIEERTHFTYVQKRLVADKNPDLSVFTKEQLDLVHDVLDHFKDSTAAALTDWTHSLPPYLDAMDGEVIPYEMVFLFNHVPVGAEDLAWAEAKLEAVGELND